MHPDEVLRKQLRGRCAAPEVCHPLQKLGHRPPALDGVDPQAVRGDSIVVCQQPLGLVPPKTLEPTRDQPVGVGEGDSQAADEVSPCGLGADQGVGVGEGALREGAGGFAEHGVDQAPGTRVQAEGGGERHVLADGVRREGPEAELGTWIEYSVKQCGVIVRP